MWKVEKTGDLAALIEFNDARSMSITIYFPAAAISFLLACLVNNLLGILAAAGVFIGSLFFFAYVRSKLLVSIHPAPNGFEFRTLGGVRTISAHKVRSSVVHGFRPAFTLIIVLRLVDHIVPLVMFTGALNTSVGGYKETLGRLRDILSQCRLGELANPNNGTRR